MFWYTSGDAELKLSKSQISRKIEGEIISAPLPPAPNPASRKGSELSHREPLGLGFPICVISKRQVTPDHLKGPGLAMCSTPVGHQEAVLSHRIRLLL